MHCLQCASVGPIFPERCPFTNPLALIDTFAVLRNPTARQVVDIHLQRAKWDSKQTGSTRSALQTLLIERSGAIVGCDITWSFKAIVPARKWLYIVAKTNHSVASIEFAQRNVKALTARALSLVKKHCCSCFEHYISFTLAEKNGVFQPLTTTNHDKSIIKNHYYSFKLFTRFYLGKTTSIIHHNQRLNCHIQPSYWTVDRGNLGSRLSC